ncbi:hypothetical protein [Arthrobacter sp. USHLN218]|uniref:hypothetical protein n=1 Tax=Arthrobacter sp. USHLN218 TaxID=3081232 RepID=UPI003016E757
MRDPNDFEAGNLAFLKLRGFDFGLLEPTPTGLAKSIMDATGPYRDFLARNGIHDYGSQPRGRDGKRILAAGFLDPSGEVVATAASLYRPGTGNGDPRIWFSGLGKYIHAGDILVTLWDGRQLLLANASQLDLSKEQWGMMNNATTQDTRPGYWQILGRLWDKATGGSDVAARPSSKTDDVWPTAPRPPGVEEACQWIREGLEASTAEPRMLFLVGGPGAGKSHAAAETVASLTERSARGDGLAHRSYRYQAADRDLLLINDATIGSDTQEQPPLITDINEAISTGSHVLACVNRGILVEESSRTRQSPGSGGAGEAAVRWLHGESDQPGAEWTIDTDVSRRSYIRSGHLIRSGRPVARVLAVFVDVCSLLERSPQVALAQPSPDRLEVRAEAYLIGDFSERSAMDASATPAGALLTEVLEIIGNSTPSDSINPRFNPILANQHSLSNPRVRNNLLSVLRASEIASTQRMTYREVWGALTRCLIGETPELVGPTGLEHYLSLIQPTSVDAIDRFNELRRLAGLRYTQALFGVSGPGIPGLDPQRNPITKLTHVIDPVKDSIPGRFDGTWNSGWATPLADAFAGTISPGSPLKALLSELDPEDAFPSAVTSFDEEVDRAFVEATQHPSLSDGDRYAFIAWYGGYLMRLYATANGIPAYRREVAAWTRAWYMAPDITEFESRLRTLLRPLRVPGQGGSASLIPLFDSRTNPIMGNLSNPKLALRSDDFDIETSTDSESLFLHLTEKGREVAQISLDFALMREALACEAGHSGITELSDATSPRLERFRAARLVPRQLRETRHFTVVSGKEEHALVVGGQS